MLGNLSLAEFFTVVSPVFFFVCGMVVYSIFVFKFYRFLARRDVFDLNLKKYNYSEHVFFKKVYSILLYLLEYVFLFPVLVFFWFLVLVVLLSFLSKGQSLETILLISIALVGAVRVTSYYKEELSKDLAKMLPFSLLGVFLVDLGYFSLVEAINKVSLIPSMFSTLLYYLLLIIALEFGLRILHFIYAPFQRNVPKDV